jgi:pyruvate formate lyase activating enzyme
VSATPLGVIHHAVDVGKAAGLKFVYPGNVSDQWEDTVCHSCGWTVVRRSGYHTQVLKLNGSVCANCGANLNFRSAESPKGYGGGCDSSSSQPEKGAQ